jgi:hypothetical protein
LPSGSITTNGGLGDIKFGGLGMKLFNVFINPKHLLYLDEGLLIDTVFGLFYF